jgi:hypothetical protein
MTVSTGTIVDATIIAAPSSTKNATGMVPDETTVCKFRHLLEERVSYCWQTRANASGVVGTVPRPMIARAASWIMKTGSRL